MTVMVVDTDSTAMEKTAKLLTDRQIAITVVLQHTAEKAEKYAMCNAVDMVFIRSILPDMSGAELLEKIKFLQPITEGYILEDGEEITVTPYGNVIKGFTEAASVSKQAI